MSSMERLLERAIRPHADLIASIVAEGWIAVVIDSPSPLGRQAARSLGWDGEAAAFKASEEGLNALATSDHVTARWIRQRRSLRVLVISGNGSALVNFEPGVGYSLEPGSSDAGCLN